MESRQKLGEYFYPSLEQLLENAYNNNEFNKLLKVIQDNKSKLAMNESEEVDLGAVSLSRALGVKKDISGLESE